MARQLASPSEQQGQGTQVTGEVLHGGKRPSSIARHELPSNLFGAELSVLPPRHLRAAPGFMGKSSWLPEYLLRYPISDPPFVHPSGEQNSQELQRGKRPT
jgi:hypothetical protein